MPAAKRYSLLVPDNFTYESPTPGQLGGYRKLRIYGRLDCPSAIRALPKGYAKHRVFFADEAAAIAAGYRPCAKCLLPRYREWKAGGAPGTPTYPWLTASRRADLRVASDIDGAIPEMRQEHSIPDSTGLSVSVPPAA